MPDINTMLKEAKPLRELDPKLCHALAGDCATIASLTDRQTARLSQIIKVNHAPILPANGVPIGLVLSLDKELIFVGVYKLPTDVEAELEGD